MAVVSPPARESVAGLAEELAPHGLLAAVAAALLLYLLVVIMTLSIAALVFSGPLAAQLPRALPGVLIGVALLVAVIGLFASYGGAVATMQNAPGAILALGAAAAGAALPQAAPEVLAATVALLLLLATLAMGAVYLALGAFRLGALVRFLPLPVVGGFLAGTGWLLLAGGVRVAADAPFDAALLEPAMLARWLPALAFGIVALAVMRRRGNPAWLAALCALAMAAFYGVMFAFGHAPAELAAAGWLLGPFPDDLAWHASVDPRALAAVDWRALAAALPVAAPAVLIGAISLLLNISALELVVKRDIALDRELMVHGAANVGCALAGGMIGFVAISLTSLGHSLAPGRRLPGMLVALLLLAAALLGTAAISAIPRLVMGGLLAYIGLGLLQDWLVHARRTMPRGDYAVLLAIFAAIAAWDLLAGVALGLVLATVLFVVNYSRIDVVRFELSGDRVRSRVSRGSGQREWLQAEGGRLLIFKLQGFVFFGTASKLVDRVRERLAGAGAVRFVLLDFEQVSGLDSTALLSFDRLRQHAGERGIELVLSGLRPALQSQWRAAGAALPPLHADADRAVEWCEQRLLDEAGLGAAAPEPFREQLLAVVPDAMRVDALLACMSRYDIAAGTTIMRRGDASDALFVVESGQFTAQLPAADERGAVRLQTMRALNVVGELGFVLGTKRSADVVADCDSVVRVLERGDWERIAANDPALARAVDMLLMRLLGQRVLHLTRVVDALQR